MPAEATKAPSRIAHRATLAVIAVVAVLCAVQPKADEEPAPEPTTTAVAFALGVAVIVLRRAGSSPVVSETTRFTVVLCSYACGIGLAGLGSWLAMDAGQARTGLAFALAALILCLRPIAPLAPPAGTTRVS